MRAILFNKFSKSIKIILKRRVGDTKGHGKNNALVHSIAHYIKIAKQIFEVADYCLHLCYRMKRILFVI